MKIRHDRVIRRIRTICKILDRKHHVCRDGQMLHEKEIFKNEYSLYKRKIKLQKLFYNSKNNYHKINSERICEQTYPNMRITPPPCKFRSIILISHFIARAYSRFYKGEHWNKVNDKHSRAFILDQKQVSSNISEITETTNERYHEIVNPVDSSNSFSNERNMNKKQNNDQATFGRRGKQQRESSRTMYMLDVW